MGELLILNKTGIDFIYKTYNFVYKRKVAMRTLVDIDKNVLKEAMEVSETTTKKETIALALEELIKSRLRQQLKGMSGSGILETGLSDLKSLHRRREMTHKILRTDRERKCSQQKVSKPNSISGIQYPPFSSTTVARFYTSCWVELELPLAIIFHHGQAIRLDFCISCSLLSKCMY